MRRAVLGGLTFLLLIQGFMVVGATLEEDLEWWKKTVIYQIYPRSFQDSDGDGVGDLQGIISRLDYFSYLNVETLWLSPIYQSPMADFGYDVSDHKAIDPIFGTMDDFDQLIQAMHEKGMKLIMDYIPNHTSDRHRWFRESRKGGTENPYSDFYVWHEGSQLENGTRQPPNNWLSIFGGSAWQWDDLRQAYYLHQFVKEQPDLNYRNPAVRKEMEDVFRFWMDRGVDGFRIDAIATLFEVEDLSLNEPPSMDPNYSQNQWPSLIHIFTEHHTDIHVVTKSWRRVIDEHEQRTGKVIYMVMEVYDAELVEAMRYYHSGADMPFNFNLIHVTPASNARWFHHQVEHWMTNMPPGKWPCFVLGNHDNKRITTRKGALYTDALNILLLSLPGTPTTYQGEEVGQLDVKVTFEQTQDPFGRFFGEAEYERFSRDPCRAPVQWSADKNAGFSNSDKTWLPVHPDYKTRNVQAQIQDPSGLSSLQIYRKMAALRRQPAFQNAAIDHVMVTDDVYAYVRGDEGTKYLVVLHLGHNASRVRLGGAVRGYGVQGGRVVVNSRIKDERLREGQYVNLANEMILEPGDAVVVQLGDQKTEL